MSLLPPRVDLLALPSELLFLIFGYLSEPQPYGSHQTILSASKTCHTLRQVAVPLLFDTVCCQIREERDGRQHTFDKLVDHQQLLQHVKTLCVRIPHHVPLCQVPLVKTQPDLRLANRNLETIEQGITGMTQLHTIRYCGTLKDCLALLERVSDRSVHVILENVYDRPHHHERPSEQDLLQALACALAGRHVSLGAFIRLQDRESLTRPLLECMRQNNLSLSSCSALRLEDSFNLISSLANISDLKELVLDAATGDQAVESSYWLRKPQSLPQTVPWGRLLRLCVHDVPFISQMRPFNLPLPNLQSLRIRPEHDLPQVSRFAYHPDGCLIGSPTPNVELTEVFRIDFSCVPSLTDLEVHGMCKHVPVDHFVAPKLRVLRLHAPHFPASTLSASSQRSPADLARIAQIAPGITHLELDIGSIKNLWHPSSIPGVDIDMNIYNMLSTLQRFQNLSTLRLFPTYVSKSTAAMLACSPDSSFHPRLDFQQPSTDPDAIAMFQRLRSQIPSLRQFSILPSTYTFCNNIRQMSSTAVVPDNYQRRFEIAWHISLWGFKTVLVTRQAGHNYSQRQVWVGQRRLTTSIQQHKYYTVCNGTSGGSLDEDDEWTLE